MFSENMLMNQTTKAPDRWLADSGGLPLYRGFEHRQSAGVVTIKSPEYRTPKNIPIDVQQQIDDWFEARFQIRFRQRSLFCSGDLALAKNYAQNWGEVRQLRALAPYSFCWSPICDDLYREFEDKPESESVEQMLERLQFRCDDLESAIRSHHEIMLVCDAVEAVPLNEASNT